MEYRIHLALHEGIHNFSSMSFLRLLDQRTGEALEFEQPEVRVGRAEGLELSVRGEDRHVVSGNHLRLIYHDGVWWLEDVGSRNGTFVGDRRLVPGVREKVQEGLVFRLGNTGPQFTVELAKRDRVSSTFGELAPIRPSAATIKMAGVYTGPPAVDGVIPEPDLPPAPPEFEIVLVNPQNERFCAKGRLLKIGRGVNCHLRPVGPGDTSVSRVHAEIALEDDGSVVIRDAGSRNGTIVNDEMIEGSRCLEPGDRLKLGAAGSELEVRRLVVPEAPSERAPLEPAAPTGDAGEPEQATRMQSSKPARPSWLRGSFGGKGATVFFRDMFEESSRKTKVRMRWIMWTFVVLLSGGLGVMYWIGEQRVRRTTRQLEQQTRLLEEQRVVADSLRAAALADYERLREELNNARAAAAPAAVVDSLRVALAEARDRTEALEAALERAQASMNRQLALGDSIRRQADAELERLRAQLGGASNSPQSAALLDSLRQAIRGAEERAANVEAQMRAVKGVDLVSVAQANQGAIGLVTTYFPDGIFDGSGFALTASGYFVTNRHVVVADGKRPDSVFVTMADQRALLRAQVVAIAASGAPDLAVLQVNGYKGPHVRKIDWTGSHMRQGEPAALIGFPAGIAAALDASQTVRTSMAAGIFSKVTAEAVQFDGFTVGGSSGSPIFNASGEVVAVHRAGLREAVGLGFGIPIGQLIPILPERAKRELRVR
ncbi:MAG: FHA domain-containing protein [Gemmatimonadales bacterium]